MKTNKNGRENRGDKSGDSSEINNHRINKSFCHWLKGRDNWGLVRIRDFGKVDQEGIIRNYGKYSGLQ